MEPIISPWLIYLLGVVNSVCVISAIGVALAGIACLVYTISAISNYVDYGSDDKDYIKEKRVVKSIFSVLVVFMLVLTITPTKNTLVAIIVSKHITPNNIEAAVGAGKSLKDEIKSDIIELLTGAENVIDAVKDKEEEQ